MLLNLLVSKTNRRDSSASNSSELGCTQFVRTFIIHCLESGMERETIMSITGHKNDATFKRYVQISSLQRTMECRN